MAKQKIEEFIGTGRRKTAVASVRLRKGTGQIKINGKPFETHFVGKIHRDIAISPLEKLSLEGNYVRIRCKKSELFHLFF